MANDFQWLLAMHDTASKYGDGLKPELAALLRRKMDGHGPDVAELNTPKASSGPAEQTATKAQLVEAGIPSIVPGSALRDGWERERAETKRSASSTPLKPKAPRRNG